MICIWLAVMCVETIVFVDTREAPKYVYMLNNLMVAIQDFLVLSDDNAQRGAQKSLALVNRTAFGSRSFGVTNHFRVVALAWMCME